MRNQQVTICPKEQAGGNAAQNEPRGTNNHGAGDIDRLVNPIAEMLKTRN